MDYNLEDYTKEEIEALALKSLKTSETEEEHLNLKITNIDKEYKKHKKESVKRALKNGTAILIIVTAILNSNADISSFATEDLSILFNNISVSIIDFASYLPASDLLVIIYAKMFEGVDFVINKLGIVGLLIASKSVKFVIHSFKDTKKGAQIKAELAELKEKLEIIKEEKKKTK